MRGSHHLICFSSVEGLFFFPLDEARFDFGHGVDDEFHEAAVLHAVLGEQIVFLEEFTDLTLTVGAGSIPRKSPVRPVFFCI